MSVLREARRIFGRLRAHLRDHAAADVITLGLDKLWVYLSYMLHRRRWARRVFSLGGRRFRWFIHHYNATWRNERAVEVALALDFLGTRRDGRVVEIGNVLSHYVPSGHEVVDKYEVAAGVRNADVMEVSGPYRTILSISTLEHVGWDESPRDPGVALRAVAHLARQLEPGGSMLATIPLGHNPGLDAAIRQGTLPFTRWWLLRRTGVEQWREGTLGEVSAVRYGEPYPGANALFVGVVMPEEEVWPA